MVMSFRSGASGGIAGIGKNPYTRRFAAFTRIVRRHEDGETLIYIEP